MQVRVDHNGKVFTDHVKKDAVVSTIQTVSHRIRGQIFFDPDQRLKDNLNSEDEFIAVTDAEVLSERGEVLERAEFLAVNKRHVVWVLPTSTNGASRTIA